MFWNIIFWALIIYFSIIVVWYLIVMIMMIIEEYLDNGFWGAVGSAIGVFLVSVWNLAKFALGIFILVLIIRFFSGKDYLGYDKANINADVKSLIYFYDNYYLNNPPDYNESLEKFKFKIKNYSTNDVNKLKEFSHYYINYRISSRNDFKEAFLQYHAGTNFNFSFSPQTIELRNKLMLYDIKDRLEFENKRVDTLICQFKEEFPELSNDELYERQQRIKSNDNEPVRLMSVIYKEIFKEEY
jgi:hypothetical protein